MLDPNLLSSYNYELPPELIAATPVIPKESAKLLVYERAKDKISHLTFAQLIDAIPKNTAIIFNDTKVIKARLFGKKQSGGTIELLLNQPLGDGKFSCYIRGKVSLDVRLSFQNGIEAKILELFDDGLRVVKFYKKGFLLNASELFGELESIGHVPLPPYIKRPDNKQDEQWYQSVFAREFGAVAAPTASLHFSDEMMSDIRQKFKTAFITLHVGAGTFKGVECDDIRKHTMHGEFYSISDEAKSLINSDMSLLGVGTTVTRCVENFARGAQKSGVCELFLNPNNRPIRQNFLLTNFHLPRSTLIMLVASFIGLEKTMQIYETAVKERYRFYSYGDGMLII
ncbi:tRNA preQ1(34) S-adenosylmethionine ribosyltransferase-isomerase QueA [Campylobacter suis]|uniref:S-adenosylmethionine:tRNA ribosyltransferase-isomerase n=1 Tax=Campylobacter suis TaxID=2790657 RepID=A0ABN7K669_9BACT|nr:tRNA preQ1(34) S-adenosylmethionine ribosyltransferase-isomerase QueA [Campylobacter suis]CAD7287111.1 S-adenosylmethionine:tRNA ribosyltransferase-isomerase [Campylobacter suis]